MNLWQNSQYLWNIVFSRRSIWVLLELIRSWTQHFSKFDQEKRKIEQICIWNRLTTGFIKHWFTSSVWNFACWVADDPPCETSLSGDERGETSAFRRLKLRVRVYKFPPYFLCILWLELVEIFPCFIFYFLIFFWWLTWQMKGLNAKISQLRNSISMYTSTYWLIS